MSVFLSVAFPADAAGWPAACIVLLLRLLRRAARPSSRKLGHRLLKLSTAHARPPARTPHVPREQKVQRGWDGGAEASQFASVPQFASTTPHGIPLFHSHGSGGGKGPTAGHGPSPVPGLSEVTVGGSDAAVGDAAMGDAAVPVTSAGPAAAAAQQVQQAQQGPQQQQQGQLDGAGQPEGMAEAAGPASAAGPAGAAGSGPRHPAAFLVDALGDHHDALGGHHGGPGHGSGARARAPAGSACLLPRDAGCTGGARAPAGLARRTRSCRMARSALLAAHLAPCTPPPPNSRVGASQIAAARHVCAPGRR